MKLKVGKSNYEAVWNVFPKKRLQQIYTYIKYKKLEPLSVEKLAAELIEFSDEIATSPKAYRVINELSNERFEYRTANFKKTYRFIYRINEKKKQVIITNLFHNKRRPDRLSAY